jgi:glycosyltransferase involved in cell wall biosynthesis
MWTALRASELIRIRHAAARALFAETNAVVAVCEWTRQLLIRNGVSKSYLIRNGVDGRKLIAAEQRQDRSRTPLRIAYLGRITAGKGLDVLLGAMRLVPELPLELDIFAVTQGSDGETLRQALSARCGQDRRIRFQPPIPSDQTVAKLREYDLLAFPSQAMEPGPLVILEALAAGAPVIGSDLGGIPEMIRHEGNGLLVEPASAAAWGTALRRLVDEPDLLPGLRRGIGPVRTMAEVAKDLEPVYEMVLENRS